jgi:farnesyl diphosphate synthase
MANIKEILKYSDLDKAIEEVTALVDATISDLIPEAEDRHDERLISAMRYAALTPGKRIRPFLTVIAASIFGVSQSSALRVAAAIEMIHAYSLVHDDLPDMDNDLIRRGMPSCHAKFDSATAILAGDALLTYAFEVLAHPDTHPDSAVRCELIASIAKASGASGMVGGQMMDIMAPHNTMSINEITRMQRMKTGGLFAVSCESGAILGKAARNLRMSLKGYANAIGLAFQITDDLLDAEGNFDEVGKNLRKDSKAGKVTYVSSIGIEKAKEQTKLIISQANCYLESFDERAELLRKLANFLLVRKR